MVSFQKLWKNHPGRESTPCDFTNQCAIRMSIALHESGVKLDSFHGAKCWSGHKPRHILRAQELADWVSKQSTIFGEKDVKKRKDIKNLSSSNYSLKQGIIFIKDGWGATDHIDLWDGTDMKGGYPDYLSTGTEIWFWELSGVNS